MYEFFQKFDFFLKKSSLKRSFFKKKLYLRQTNTSTGQIPLNFSSLSDTSSSLLTQKPDTEQAITEFKTPQPRIPPLKFKLSHPLNVSSELLVLSPTKSKKRKRKNDEGQYNSLIFHSNFFFLY